MDSLTIQVKFKDYSFLILECDYGIAQEISEWQLLKIGEPVARCNCFYI